MNQRVKKYQRNSDGYKPIRVPNALMAIQSKGDHLNLIQMSYAMSPGTREESSIKAISCIELPVKDMQRAEDFYVRSYVER